MGAIILIFWLEWKNFLDDQVRKLSFEALQRNAYFLNPENVLLAMLADDTEEIRNKAVMQILTIRKIKSTKNGSKTHNFIRRFFYSIINFDATCYHEITNNLSANTKEPFSTQNL